MDWLNFYVVNKHRVKLFRLASHMGGGGGGGGYLHDFPFLLSSGMKYNCDQFGILPESLFVDIMQILQVDGYKRPGLDALCEEIIQKENRIQH